MIGKCFITGGKCLKLGCKQFIERGKLTQCKLEYIRTYAIKFGDLARLINFFVEGR